MRAMLVVAAGVAATVVLPLAAAGAAATAVSSAGAGAAPEGSIVAGASAVGAVPSGMLRLYERAATTCPGLPWTVVAAIGTVESDNGRSQLPGVQSGSNFAGAEGPMQFEPPTFARYDQPVPPGGADPPSPYDATDAVYATARDLCANGGRGGTNLFGAVFAYNHSDSYVGHVLALARSYGRSPAAPVTAGGAAHGALVWALSQLGVPYRWGGEAPGVAFDCSGLVQAAYRSVGVGLPRVAQDQWDAGPALAPGEVLEPGDLVFFGGSATDVQHVGMVVRPGVMVDAPHTGAFVREEPFPTVPGTAWGSDIYVGATRPAG